MSFALLEILIPLIISFILGLIIGWLVWRWRRRLVSSTEWNNLSSAANRSKSDLASLEAANAELTIERKTLTGEVSTLTGQYESSRTELDSASRSVEALKSDIGSRDEELATLRSSLEQRDQKLSGLEGDLSKANATISGFKKLEGESTKLRGQVDASGKRINELEGSLEKSLTDVQAAQSQATKAESRADAADAELEKLRGELDAARSEVSGRDGRIGELEAAVAGSAATAVALRDNEKANEDLAQQLAAARSELDSGQARIADLDSTVASTRGELDSANARIGELKGQLDGANQALAAKDGEIESAQTQIVGLAQFETDANTKGQQLDEAHARIGELEGHMGDMANLREQLDTANGNVHDANGRIADLEARLAEQQLLQDQINAANAQNEQANARIGELEGQLNEVGQLRIDLTERDRRIEALELSLAQQNTDQASIDDLRRQLAEANQQVEGSMHTIDDKETVIIDLRKQLEAKEAEAAALPEPLRRVASFHAGSWKKGQTKLGTAGADHTDDLKVVSGIGPQMEKLLNSFDIISWEQLAALTDEEVQVVDAALEDFPGRITRDEWVPQAKAIMDAGHKPVERAPKPRPKKTPAWQRGTTTLGTPGAGHTDDLKVINGIGPKMEKLLNGFGITAWEQLGALTKSEVAKVDAALQEFPGRIERDEWVAQAGELVKEFPVQGDRPNSKNYLHRSAANA